MKPPERAKAQREAEQQLRRAAQPQPHPVAAEATEAPVRPVPLRPAALGLRPAPTPPVDPVARIPEGFVLSTMEYARSREQLEAVRVARRGGKRVYQYHRCHSVVVSRRSGRHYAVVETPGSSSRVQLRPLHSDGAFGAPVRWTTRSELRRGYATYGVVAVPTESHVAPRRAGPGRRSTSYLVGCLLEALVFGIPLLYLLYKVVFDD
jgi:hypothetical protein